jgi:hypothetical protein
MYVGIGLDGLYYSYDGLKWKVSVTSMKSVTNNPGKIIWNGYIWVAGGSNVSSKNIAYSKDGINWSTKFISEINHTNGVMDIAWNGTIFVAVGFNTTFTRLYSTSQDGITWSSAVSL